jgi:hypothetical protein
MAGGLEDDADVFEELIGAYGAEITRVSELILLEVQEKFIETSIKYKKRHWSLASDDVPDYLSVEFIPTLDAVTALLGAISKNLDATDRLAYQILDFMDTYIVESIICTSKHTFSRAGVRQLEFDVMVGLVRAVGIIHDDAAGMFKRYDIWLWLIW